MDQLTHIGKVLCYYLLLLSFYTAFYCAQQFKWVALSTIQVITRTLEKTHLHQALNRLNGFFLLSYLG